uniref:Ig-like domain-containing protein n=1 Tax=Oryzias latipes TaxID=8090 RepID=A0A3P9KWN9_ORYLA
MTLLVFSGCVTCLLLGTVALSWAQKPSPSLHFQSVHVGDEVTLECVRERTRSYIFFWYKQPLGLKPQLMSEYLDFKKNGTFIDAFKNDPRLKLETDKDKNHLKISNLKLSDSATYYCISSDLYGFKHLEGYILHVKDSTSDIHASMDQSSSENFHAGDSVTLNCTVHTGSCDGEQRVYWFKDSGDSHPGLIYTHGGRNDPCGRKNNTQTHGCVYELHMERLTESHAGIYYCAVVSCGHILFGNGTKLDLTEGSFPPFVYFLSGALAASLIFLTSYAIHKIRTRKSREVDTFPDFEIDDLHYAVLRHSKVYKSRREERRIQ